MFLRTSSFTDIDECTTGTHDCVFPFLCMDIFGSFTCNCTQGTLLTGQECVGEQNWNNDLGV